MEIEQKIEVKQKKSYEETVTDHFKHFVGMKPYMMMYVNDAGESVFSMVFPKNTLMDIKEFAKHCGKFLFQCIKRVYFDTNDKKL